MMDLREYKLHLRENITNWQGEAACKDLGPKLFYSSQAAEIEEAKGICARCSVRTACLEYALANMEYGVWGGYDEDQRRRMRRRAIRYKALPITESITALAKDS